MSLDPTLFDTTNFETANETVLSLYEKIRESHLRGEASRLRGLLPMKDADLGRAVQRELVFIRKAALESGEENVLAAVLIAIDAVKWALEAPEFRVAS
jgi:hypothetical protein